MISRELSPSLVRASSSAWPDAVDHRGEGDTAVGMGLGIEEDFGVAHVLSMRAGEIGPGQIVEILSLDQHAGAGIVDVEKILQVREGICRPYFLHRGVGQPDAVAACNGEHQLGLEGAFDVQVQLGLRQGGDEAGDIGHGSIPTLTDRDRSSRFAN